MPNKNIEDLDAQVLLGLSDYIPVAVEAGGGLYTAKKVLRSDLLRLSQMTEATSLLPGDMLMLETTGPALKKVKWSTLTGLRFVQTELLQITTNVEQSIIGTGVGSKVVPAGWFTTVGRGVRMRCFGTYDSGATPSSLAVNLIIGTATPIVTLNCGFYPETEGGYWDAEFNALCPSSGVVDAYGKMSFYGADGAVKSFMSGGGTSCNPDIGNTVVLNGQLSVGTDVFSQGKVIIELTQTP